MFPLDDNFVFGDIFFLWLKKYSANKKKILTNKRSYSSNGNTYMPMIWRFYAPPPPPQRKNIELNILFFFYLVDIFFAQKNVPTMVFSTGNFSFYFSFSIGNRIFFFTNLGFSFLLKLPKSWFLFKNNWDVI